MQKMLLPVAVVALIAACGKTGDVPVVDCTGSTPTYDLVVKAILDAECATSGCHDASTKEKGFDFSTYSAAKATASKKGDVLGSINHTSGYKKMPEGRAKLSDAQIKLITCWYENGTPQ